MAHEIRARIRVVDSETTKFLRQMKKKMSLSLQLSRRKEGKKQFQFHTIHIIQVHFNAKQTDYNVSIDNLNEGLNCGIDILHAISRISASLSVARFAAT